VQNELFASRAADLHAILDQERDILLSGNLDEMAELVDHKEHVIDLLTELDPGDGEVLQHLNAKLHRNQALLDKALEGIRAVSKRLSALHQVRRSLDTYDSFGEKQTFEMEKQVTLEKRA